MLFHVLIQKVLSGFLHHIMIYIGNIISRILQHQKKNQNFKALETSAIRKLMIFIYSQNDKIVSIHCAVILPFGFYWVSLPDFGCNITFHKVGKQLLEWHPVTNLAYNSINPAKLKPLRHG
jgi:hypothetical protein